ncbi:glutamate synthase subunit beta [Flavobacterium sp. NRK F10]|uniref:glutamate synthase subunit beta n=1 Tax=Flavobacterium sp. NRK F10 TaxID=2954931 RepID=UPI002091BF48|nr:glutamate synthase subunit beta [Flavobacterium sp. NRK F10]MCO6174358.1 glutamate synthase subunit beta [Flavobacterium sp. NRK F10]
MDGFLKYKRELPEKQKVAERIKHFSEFTLPFDTQKEQEQSARCMDCGVPFCHYKCPLDNNISDFNKAAFEGRWKDAYQILSKTNPFPEFTGRICPAPCEQGCVLGINSDAVTIEEIEKTIIEKAFENNWITIEKPKERNGIKIAIIGSGPAGLAAAYYLNSYGYTVSVYEKDKEPGGLLRYGIPDFKLNKSVIKRRIELLKEVGIQFYTQTEIGKNISSEELEQKYDKIILAIGSQKERQYDIPLDTFTNAYYAMDYLTETNKFISDEISKKKINANGKHVIVIGGGDTGSDCIGTANREGALSVTELDYHEKPPKERSESTPWPMDALQYKDSTSHEEGSQRIFKNYATQFNTDETNTIISITISEVKIGIDQNGNRTKEIISNTSRTLPCDLLLVAIGFTGSVAISGSSVTWHKQRFNSQNYNTSNPKYFTIGDARIGASLVVNAIADGRNLAKYIHTNDFNQ